LKDERPRWRNGHTSGTRRAVVHPISGLPEIGIFDAQVGYSRLCVACPAAPGKHLRMTVVDLNESIPTEWNML
jgi:hypothetical protein